MALSGSFSGSIKSGNYKLRVDWSATQSVSGNTSKITAVMYLVQASGWSLGISARSGNSTSIAGTSYSWGSPAISNGGGKTTKLATVTSGNISHNADGTKSVTITATFKIEATISGTYYGTITASDTVTLNTIPRATQPKLSASSVNMGAALTVSLPRASSSFVHDLSYKFAGSAWKSIVTGVGTSYAWTVPDLATSIPNATSGTVTVRCVTRNGGTTIGTKTAVFTAKVPSSVVPTISAVTFAETVAGIAAQFGAFVRSKSAVKATITAAGAKGSTIKSYTATLQGKTYTGASWTSSTLTSSGSLPVKVTVKDSRGRTASKTSNITVLGYSPPEVRSLNAYRVGADGLAQDDGVGLSIGWDYAVASVGGKNTAAAVIEYKRTTATTWESTPLHTSSSLSGSGVKLVQDVTLSTDYQYDVRLTVKDWFGAEAAYVVTVPSGRVIVDLKADGSGVGIGKTAELPGVNMGWPVVGQELTTQNQAGQYVTFDGLLIQWGGVSITPSAAGTPTTAVVDFPRPFASTPTVFATPVSSVPQSLSVAIQRAASVVGDPAASVAITLTRDGTTTTGINWLAIGPAAVTTIPTGYVLMDADGYALRDADGYILTVEE